MPVQTGPAGESGLSPDGPRPARMPVDLQQARVWMQNHFHPELEPRPRAHQAEPLVKAERTTAPDC